MASIILLILVISIFLSVMLSALVIQLKPDALKIFGKYVCRTDEQLEIAHSTASYHQPGEKSIHIYCSNHGKQRSVKGKVLLLTLLISFLLTLPITSLIVFLVYRQF